MPLLVITSSRGKRRCVRRRQHLQQAQQLLREIQRDAKADTILKRADLAPIASAK